MHFRHLLTALLYLLISNFSYADSYSDRQIQGVMSDIEKYENQFSGQATPRTSNVNRALKLLGLRRQTLDRITDHSAQKWIAADQRFKALVSRLHGFLQEKTQPSAPPTSTAQRKSASTVSKPASQSKPMISHYRVKLKKLKRDMESVASTLGTGGPKPFQDLAYVEKYEILTNRYKQSLEQYSGYAGDPDVVAANAAYDNLMKLLSAGKRQAAKESASLGDTQSRLKKINQVIQKMSIPKTPSPPYKKGELGTWLVALAKQQQQAQAVLIPLSEIKQRAHLPNNRLTVEQGAPYDFNDVLRMQRSVNGIIKKISDVLKTFSENLALNVQQIPGTLDFYNTFDPADASRYAIQFLGKGRATEIRTTLKQQEVLITEAAEYARLLGNTAQYKQRTALLNNIRRTRAQYDENRKKALARVRMPVAASADSALIEIVKKTLSNPNYGVGDIKRMVINADKVHRSKEESEEKFDGIDVSLSGTVTLTGTKTTYHYEWDEFQTATAEPADGKYYIFYNTLKYFTSGASSTPLNRWILSKRIQGNEIPEDSIEK